MARKRARPGGGEAPRPTEASGAAGRSGLLATAVALAVAVGVGVARRGTSSAGEAGHLEALASSLVGEASGGWAADVAPLELLEGLGENGGTWCDFAVVNASDLDATRFERDFRSRGAPVVVRGGAARWGARSRWAKEALRASYGVRATQYGPGSDIIYAGGGDSNRATLRQLLDRVDNASAALAADPDSGAADDVFAFDVKVLQAIPELGRDFSTPRALRRAFPRESLASGAAWRLLSLGPSRAGLPLHAHGETWLGVAHGAKRWFAYAPGDGPARETTKRLHPLASARSWYRAVYADAGHRPLTCLQRAGDALYLPAGWKHATLNVGETVAAGEQAGYAAAERFATSTRALQGSPHDVEALHGAGIAAAHLAFEGRPDLFAKSVDYLSRAVAERPLQPEVNIILGEVLSAAGDRPAAHRAVDDCRRAYKAHTEQTLLGEPSAAALAAVHLKFGRFYLGTEMWDRALAPLGDALALRPDYAEALKDRALAHERLGDRRKARRDLEAALRAAPDDAAIAPRLALLSAS